MDYTREGGYDYEFVSGPPSDDYTCLICTLVAREAQQAGCCGRIFCKECLGRLTTTGNTKCPNCREDLEGKYFPDIRAIRNINQLKVYCENKDGGCTWNGELRHTETHYDGCPHRIVSCPDNCNEIVKSMDLPQHLQTQCPNREIECNFCGQIGAYLYISTEHLGQCPDFEIDCPNHDCQEKPKRKDMEAHRQECPKEIVSCGYADIGCEHVCLREDLLQHSADQMQLHLYLAVKELRIFRTLLEGRTATHQNQVLKMTKFAILKKSKKEWYSPPFYTFPGGYKMCLNVCAGGEGDGKGTHISAFLNLMAGESDEILEWPMRGEFSIELLNQQRDENHRQHFVQFTGKESTEYNSKVSKRLAISGYGTDKFVSHKDLQEQSLSPPIQYLKDDTLYFRVTMTKAESSSKPWLAGAIS